MSKVKVILFDFDGVIVDSFAFCYKIINARDSITAEEYRARFEGNINDAPKKTVKNSTTDKYFDFFGQYAPELMACKPNQEMVEVIQELSLRHTLIIVSSTISQPISNYLEICDLRRDFQEILGNDVEKSKVKKIQDILERYDLKPAETVFVTDTLGDIREAQECGVRSIAVTWGYHARETLEKGKPYKIVNEPSEILDVIKAIK